MQGFLNVYKPRGMTSHDVVAVLRRVTKIKQIGHTGTLDPFAEGVLPICIGKATRLIEYLTDDKAYIATLQFGKTTDTYDIEGQIISQSDKKVSKDDIVNVLKKYQGEIEQVPPIYSALKVNGKKLYEYAREGKDVEIKSRKVIIEKIDLLSFDDELQQAEIYVKCSKGTYIRSLGFDIGNDLTCGAYLSKLIRVQAGDFKLDESIKLDDFSSFDINKKNIISPISKIPLEKVIINDVEMKRVSNGLQIYPRVGIAGMVGLIYSDNLVGVALASEQEIKIKKFIG